MWNDSYTILLGIAGFVCLIFWCIAHLGGRCPRCRSKKWVQIGRASSLKNQSVVPARCKNCGYLFSITGVESREVRFW